MILLYFTFYRIDSKTKIFYQHILAIFTDNLSKLGKTRLENRKQYFNNSPKMVLCCTLLKH